MEIRRVDTKPTDYTWAFMLLFRICCWYNMSLSADRLAIRAEWRGQHIVRLLCDLQGCNPRHSYLNGSPTEYNEMNTNPTASHSN